MKKLLVTAALAIVCQIAFASTAMASYHGYRGYGRIGFRPHLQIMVAPPIIAGAYAAPYIAVNPYPNIYYNQGMYYGGGYRTVAPRGYYGGGYGYHRGGSGYNRSGYGHYRR